MGNCCSSHFWWPSKTYEIPISSPSDKYTPPPPRPPPTATANSATATATAETGPILKRPYEDINQLYKLDKELGRGQFGITYLCTERSSGLQYACKAIPRLKLKHRKDIEDVRREIMMLQHLSGQPNIVEFKGAYEDRKSLYVVMELCSGGELFDRIVAKGSYSEKEAAVVFRQIVNVVHVCHFMGVMHRDLKPENFLLVSKADDSPIKITDFGLSVFIEEEYESWTSICRGIQKPLEKIIGSIYDKISPLPYAYSKDGKKILVGVEKLPKNFICCDLECQDAIEIRIPGLPVGSNNVFVAVPWVESIVQLPV